MISKEKEAEEKAKNIMGEESLSDSSLHQQI